MSMDLESIFGQGLRLKVRLLQKHFVTGAENRACEYVSYFEGASGSLVGLWFLESWFEVAKVTDAVDAQGCAFIGCPFDFHFRLEARES